MTTEIKTGIIGTGNVAYHLCKAFCNAGHPPVFVSGRNVEKGERLSRVFGIPYHRDIKNLPGDADIYIICVKDEAIHKVSSSLPIEVKKSKIIAHTSGSIPIQNLSEDIAKKASFYPLQSLTADAQIDYSKIPWILTSECPEISERLARLAKMISNDVYYYSDEQKKHIHLAAVMANNFTNHIIYLAEKHLENHHISPQILFPLIDETFKKIQNLPPLEAQTGPARRKDTRTITTHLDMIDDLRTKVIYYQLSKSISDLYHHNKD